MQTLNFKYIENNKFKRTLNFKYCNNSNELLFSYQRISNILQASKFNEPVAVIKTAPGFITMQELWVSKLAKQTDKNKINKYLFRYNHDLLLNNIINARPLHGNTLNKQKIINALKINNDNLSKYKNIYSVTNDIILNKFANHLATPSIKNTNLIENIYTIKPECVVNIYKIILSKPENKYILLNKNIFIPQQEKINNIFKNYFTQETLFNDIYLNQETFVHRKIYKSDVNKSIDLYKLPHNLFTHNFLFLNKPINNLMLNKNIWIDSRTKEININKIINLSFGKIKDINIYKNVWFYSDYKNLDINKNIFGFKDNLLASISKNIHAFKDRLTGLNQYYNIFAYTDIKYGDIFKNEFISMDYKKANIDKNIFADTLTKELITNKNIYIIKEKEKAFYLRDDFFKINKDINDLFLSYRNLFADKLKKEAFYNHNELLLGTRRKGSDILTNDINLYKDIYGSFLVEDKIYTNLFLNKNKDAYGVSTDNTFTDYKAFLYKDLTGTRHSNENIFFGKRQENLYKFSQEFLYLDANDVAIFKQKPFMAKALLEANIDYDITYLSKRVKDLNLLNQYYGIFIPIEISNSNAYVDYINLFLDKDSKKSDILGFLDFTKIEMNLDILSNDTLVSKREHDTYIQYRNYWALKDRFNSLINKDLNIFKSYKPTNINPYLWLAKKERNTDLFSRTGYDYPSTTKTETSTSFFNFNGDPRDKKGYIFLGKKEGLVYLFNQYFLNKEYKSVFTDKKLFLDITDKDINTFTQVISLDKENKEVMILDLPSLLKEKYDLETNQQGLFINKISKDMDILKQLNYIHTMAKESRIDEHIGEWAWAYEPPDPFNTNAFGIDELLLPEVDTRYEDFEELIFNKTTMKPRNPIQVIDTNTWVAKLPVKHPLPERKNIGNVYTGVIRENYFGIRTSIMHQVYLEFYTLWQSHIFEFAPMTMTQSLKKMLEYLYSYILDNYNDTQLPEALRVYHQIRWFGECAVLNNSQYIISIERDNLKSNLQTGGCSIPNNLNSQDTMYIDSTPGICAIRNNEAYIGSDRAYVEFYLKTHANTTIRFDLINTIGSVNIYIDDTLVDTLSTSKIGALYELNYTGETITVRIEKTRENNLNNKFYICNIIVANESYKDLSVEFDPTLKAGNAPMDEIAKKMIQYANSFDDFTEAYEHIKKANLGVSVTMNQMNEYWEKHHQDKLKGKRLTIKKT